MAANALRVASRYMRAGVSHEDALQEVINFGYAEHVPSERAWVFEEIPGSGSDVVPDRVMEDLIGWGFVKKVQMEVGPPGGGSKSWFAQPTSKGEQAIAHLTKAHGFRIVRLPLSRFPRSKDIRNAPGGSRVHFPYSGRNQFNEPNLKWGPQSATPEAAYRAAEQVGKKYESEYWPGGMADVVAVADHGLHLGNKRFSGIINTGYSST